MDPQIRPASCLTADILTTSSHWVIMSLRNAFVVATTGIHFYSVSREGNEYPMPAIDCPNNQADMPQKGTRCYPCRYDSEKGIVTPEPWPLLPGEDVIDALEGIDPNKYGVGLSPATNVWTVYEGRMGWLSCGFRQDMHPAPRKGGKWVWESDDPQRR